MPIKLNEFSKYQEELKAYFPPSDLQWKVGATNRDKTKGIALAYINSSAVMDRLDNVLGAENWTKRHDWGDKGEIMCGISILFEYPDGTLHWHTKWDAGVQPDFEPEKGGISDSLKRSANCWGIGRYLRQFPSMWLPIKQQGKSYTFKKQPQVPNEFLPDEYKSGDSRKKPNSQSNQVNSQSNQADNQPVNNHRKEELTQMIGNNKELMIAVTEFLDKHQRDRVSELNEENYNKLKSFLKDLKNHSA